MAYSSHDRAAARSATEDSLVTLTELFDRSLLGRRDRPAVEWGDAGGGVRTVTFGDVDARASQMAQELNARGLSAGDRLCLQLPNSLEFIDLYLACTRLGIIFVPINVLYRERELRHIVTDAEPRAFIVAGSGERALVRGMADDAIWEISDVAAAARRRPTTRLSATLHDTSPAAIIYTSGTTGTSKGAVLTHANFMANGMNVVTSWRITEADRYLAVLPLFHVHGLGNGLHAWLASGCLMRLTERFDHQRAASLFSEFRPTLFFGVPTIYVRLLDPVVIPDATAEAMGTAARLFVSGSAPLPAHVHEAFRLRYGHTILERYGMTEALMIATNPYDGERRAGTVGMPFPGVSLRIFAVTEATEPTPDRQVGEVQVKSPSLFAEYWRNPQATAAAFDGGWFRTGDVGVLSSDGYLTLRGRRGDLIISGGFNIYPREIEEVLLEDPAVREAAVAGAPDALRGEVPVAYVVTEHEPDARALEERCRAQLASFKVPRAFIRVDALPRTALGKVQKHLLPAWRGTTAASSGTSDESRSG